MSTIKCNKCKHELDMDLFSIKSNGNRNKICKNCIDKKLEQYNARKNNKRCVNCDVKITQGKRVLCKDCLSAAKECQTHKREFARDNNKCIICFIRDCQYGYSKCKRCTDKYKLPIVTKLYRNAKSRAKKSNIEFTISERDIIVPEYCPILNIKLTENIGESGPDSYSLDRINNKLGYIPGNVHVISMRANQIKNDSTIEELEMLLNYLRLMKS